LRKSRESSRSGITHGWYSRTQLRWSVIVPLIALWASAQRLSLEKALASDHVAMAHFAA
jgi:hypothetical protein